jgi:hypothetical protein
MDWFHEISRFPSELRACPRRNSRLSARGTSDTCIREPVAIHFHADKFVPSYSSGSTSRHAGRIMTVRWLFATRAVTAPSLRAGNAATTPSPGSESVPAPCTRCRRAGSHPGLSPARSSCANENCEPRAQQDQKLTLAWLSNLRAEAAQEFAAKTMKGGAGANAGQLRVRNTPAGNRSEIATTRRAPQPAAFLCTLICGIDISIRIEFNAT